MVVFCSVGVEDGLLLGKRVLAAKGVCFVLDVLVLLLVAWRCLGYLELWVWIHSLWLLSWMTLVLSRRQRQVPHCLCCLFLQFGDDSFFSFSIILTLITLEHWLNLWWRNGWHRRFLNIIHFYLQYTFVFAIDFWMLHHELLRRKLLFAWPSRRYSLRWVSENAHIWLIFTIKLLLFFFVISSINIHWILFFRMSLRWIFLRQRDFRKVLLSRNWANIFDYGHLQLHFRWFALII